MSAGRKIRIWNGSKVVQVVEVMPDGGSSVMGAVGGAHNATQIDIEIDPWAGLIHTRGVEGSPIYFATVQARDE